MPLELAGIPVPDFPHLEFVFPRDLAVPIPIEYPFVREIAPDVVIHEFGSVSAKVEQRFYLGDGLRRFHLQFEALTPEELDSLQDFWELTQGGLASFDFVALNPDQTSWEYVRVRFEQQNISFRTLDNLLTSVGVTLVVIPSTVPVYPLNGDPLERFPSARNPNTGTITISAFADALTAQSHTIIPLLKITTADAHAQVLYLADRSCTIGEQFYHPRLAEWGPISQQMGGGSDKTNFVLGDADRVIAAVASAHQLRDARVEFSLFHVESGIRVDLWAGRIRNYTRNSGPTIPIECDEGVPLQISYPQTNSRQCWKIFAGTDCRWAGQTAHARTLNLAGLNEDKSRQTKDYTFAPLTDQCDKGWDTPNGCLAHLNELNFGAIVAQVQSVRTKDNTTGVMGFGRSILTSASQIADSVYAEVLPEIYMKTGNTDGAKGYPVKAKIVAGRDEGDFYAALGVVGRGPIAKYAEAVFDPNDPNATVPFTLDGQPWFGVDKNTAGLRWAQGFDPALPQDNFNLGEGGNGPQRYVEGLYAAGIAFVEMRRTDAKGLQLSTPDGHDMEVTVREGLGGWLWDAPGFRRWVEPLTYPVWVEINVFLRALGLQGSFDSPPDLAIQEAVFDVAAAVAAQSQWCSQIVDKLIGGEGKEDQFVFNGVLRENKPLRDWLDEIENNFLGYHVWSSGKLRIGVRGNSSGLSGFTDGNILFRSLEFPPVEPAFNSITAQIADEESGYVLIPVSITDYDAALEAGGGVKQEVRPMKMPLSGTAGKSQAARIVTTRLREEIGGITAAQRRALTGVRFKTTVLALDTEAGMVVDLIHPDCPNYPPKLDGTLARDNYVEFRIQSWTLNKDFSIDISGRSTHDDMYDLVFGPKPDDVLGDPVPGLDLFAPANWRFELWCHQDGIVHLNNLACGTNSRSVAALRSSLYCIDEASDKYGTLVGRPGPGNLGGIENTTDTEFVYNGLAPVPGEWVLCGPEIMEVLTSNPAGDDPANFGIFTVKRGALGSIPTATPIVAGSVLAVNPDWPCELTVTEGDWRPGTALVVNDGSWPAVPAPQQMTTEYLKDTQTLRTDLPLAVTVGSNIYQHPRLWLVKRIDHTTALPLGFFYTPQRATFEDTFTLENAGIVAVKAYLENSRHLKSKELTLFPVSGQRMEPKVEFTPAWPYRIRTLGNAKMLLPDKDMPLGPRTDVFLPVPVSHPQAFAWALATIWRGNTGILDTPPSIQVIKLITFEASGHVAIGGSFEPGLQLQIVVAGGNEAKSLTYYVDDHADINSIAALVASIVDWLKNDSVWSDFYQTNINPSDPTVLDLIDLTGRGGTITVTTNDTSGNLTTIVSSFTPPLGVMHGRQYALAYIGGGNRSDLSVISPTTGPTGDATEIQIRDLPMSADASVTDVEIYAYPDGDTASMPFLVGTVPNGTPWFVDDTTESELSSLIQYSVPAQPETAGPVLCTVKRGGVAWFQLFIPKNANISNQPHGFGIDLIQADSEINVDIDNEAAEGLSFVIEIT